MTGWEPPYIREHDREQKERRSRVAMFRKIINTYAFGTLGASVGDVVLQGKAFGLINTLSIMLALALHALVIYLAPIGAEKSDD